MEHKIAACARNAGAAVGSSGRHVPGHQVRCSAAFRICQGQPAKGAQSPLRAQWPVCNDVCKIQKARVTHTQIFSAAVAVHVEQEMQNEQLEKARRSVVNQMPGGSTAAQGQSKQSSHVVDLVQLEHLEFQASLHTTGDAPPIHFACYTHTSTHTQP